MYSYNSLSLYTHNGITLKEEKMIQRAFDENYKHELTSTINVYCALLENKENWYELAINSAYFTNLFNKTYSDMMKLFKRIHEKLKQQFKYNLLHERFVFTVFKKYIDLVIDFMGDLRWPMDYFMQKIASERLKDDIRLRNINKVILIIKSRIKELNQFKLLC